MKAIINMKKLLSHGEIKTISLY